MKIITHDGTFHTDEVFAIALLKKFVKSNVEVIRTRDEKVLAESKKDKNVFVIDVGREFNFSMKNFDHHQREFNYRWKEGILYSSCGLIWNFLKKKGYLKKYNYKTLLSIENKLIKKIDLHDNGETFWSLSNMVKICNREDNTMEDFNKALNLASTYLDNTFYQENHAEGLNDFFEEDLKKYNGDKIFYSSLPNNGSFLKYLSTRTNAEVLIYKQLDEEGNDKWYAKSITKYNTIKKNNYEVFSSLAPETWRGLSNNELKSVTKLKGSVFVHKTGYLCVARNKKSITSMAKEMLKNHIMIKENKT
jgi:uncharacterized UPF0160 family protein